MRIVNQVGVHRLLNFLRDLGISSLNQKPEHYGLALTLGVGDISLFELTRAYSIFAHQGKLCEFHILEKKDYKCRQIIEPRYINDIVYILSNRYFKLESFPINSNLDFPDRFVFKKTGTSRNFSDNFTIGFTKNYMIGVWVGNKDGEMMRGVSGASGAGEIFHKIVDLLETDKYKPQAEKISGSKDRFIQIISPLDGSVFRKNTSIPMDKQQVRLDFQTNIDYDQARWYINGDRYIKKFVSIDKVGKYDISLELWKNGKQIKTDSINYEIVRNE